ncbi:DNA-binding transcriptional regulator CynR [Pseudomonas aeruginosa]|nr:DNA-binding transcriptional regulator CynR [Pseudomonas aeruginosa]
MLLRHLRYLLAVAEHRNFTRAAEALHVSQPTLSQQVRQLEEQLRVQLLDRSGRSVRPTDAGELYLLHARRALRELEAAQRAIHEVRDLSRGRLRLGMTPTFTCYLVGALVDPFNQRYPGIELSLEELPQDALEAALIDDRLDLGVAFSEPGSVEIDSQPLYLERLGLVLGAEHPAADAPLAAAALAELPLALLRDDFATRRHIDAYLRQQGVTARVALEANSISAIVDVVRRGRLASILPEAVARQQAGLRCVALRPALPTRQVALFWRQGSHPRCRAPGLPGPGAGARRRAGRRLSGISRDSAATPRAPRGAGGGPGRRRTGRAGR